MFDAFRRKSVVLCGVLLLLCMATGAAQEKKEKANTGRAVIVGKDGAAYKAPGEPVPGAEIFIELEPDDEPIYNSSTDETGVLTIEFPNQGENLPHIGALPRLGTFKIIVVPPKKMIKKFELDPSRKDVIKVAFNKEKDGQVTKNKTLIFKYLITWVPSKDKIKGGFAVSGAVMRNEKNTQ